MLYQLLVQSPMPRLDNTRFYTSAIKKHGTSAKGLNWHDTHSQMKRFEIIYEFIKPHLHQASLVNAGCGFGDLYHFLQNFESSFKYRGYDSVKEMVDIAKENTKQPIQLKDILTDSLATADIYIASGSLNILNRFETYLFIKRCFDQSRVGFCFNLLYGEDDSQHFNHFLPHEIKQFVKDLPCECEIVSGYLPSDFTVFLKRI